MRNTKGTSARLCQLGIMLVLIVAVMPFGRVAAAPPSNSHFERTWARTDRPVLDQQVNRTWMWGPEAFTGELQEPFSESPGGVRRVQYFDKSRMEINNTGESMDSIWYVTNGLLVVEMMTGRLQTGMNRWETRLPASINVAGDANDPLGATYRYFGFLRDLPAKQFGAAINETVSPGAASNLFMYNDRFLTYGATASYFVPETGHTVASPFWNFMNSSGLVYDSGGTFNDALFVNPFYATGYPVTEAYWAMAKVGGIDTDVLIQCFERRCLTYTPSNSAGWQVEAGNVGQHYYSWRYGGEGVTDPGNRPPTSIEPLPTMIYSPMWLDPESAMHWYFQQNGSYFRPNDPAMRYYVDLMHALPGLYSVTTAPIGTFNHDTRNFPNWLIELRPGSGLGYSIDYLCQQSYASIYVPDSNIARRLREFEQAFEQAERGSGAYAYFLFSILPIANPIHMSVLAYPVEWGRFNVMLEDFRGARVVAPDLRFGEYAVQRGYLPILCGNASEFVFQP